MWKITVLIFGLLLMNCVKVKTASDENTQINSNKAATASPTIESKILLKPVTPNVKFNAKQRKYLNESLSLKVREVLEKAEKLEVLAEVHTDDKDDGDWRTFEPNRILKVVDEADKKALLGAFYHDASREDSPAICYYPRHLIRAIYQGETVEIEICFSCSRYTVRSDLGEFDGTIVRDNRKSEDFLSKIIKSKGVELK